MNKPQAEGNVNSINNIFNYSEFACILRNTKPVFVRARGVTACSYLVSIRTLHTTIPLNMWTEELAVNKCENKATGANYLKSSSDIFLYINK